MTEEVTNADTAGTAGSAAAAATGAAGTGTTENTAPAVGWYPEASPEEIKVIQSKGWDKEANPPAVSILKSYNHLEKLFGADRAGNTVVLPAGDADETTLNQFYNKLGRPESVDKYTAPAFESLDENANKSLRDTAHKIGITDKQLAALADWNKETQAQVVQTLTQNVQIDEAAQIASLKKEWGQAYEGNIQLAKEAVGKLGWTTEQINSMQIGLGFDGVMKLARQIGASTGESAFVAGDSGRAGGRDNAAMSPEQAKTELNKLSTDADFQKAWTDKTHPRHSEMVARKSQLSAWSVGQK